MKGYSVILLDDAIDDLERGADFYGFDCLQVGKLFLDSLFSDIFWNLLRNLRKIGAARCRSRSTPEP